MGGFGGVLVRLAVGVHGVGVGMLMVWMCPGLLCEYEYGACGT